jgi:CubicO group peptidase (beta-lactamase class C family)
MDDLSKRLATLTPTIEKLMRIAGTPGLSLGVLHQGKTVYFANFGYRDVQSKLPPTEETIYPGCSLTKALVAETVGTLVEEGKLEWDTRVKDILPDFNIKDDTIRSQATITDLLSHRTGFTVSDYYLGAENNVLISKEDTLVFLNDQIAIQPIRSTWQYNNLGYELVSLMIDKVSSSSWADLLRDRIFKPLQLKRTMLDYPPKDDGNVAKAYSALDDASPTEIHTVKATDKIFSGAAAGLRTCVKDLLVLYDAFMLAANDQFATGKTSTSGSPLKQVNHIMSARIPMGGPTLNEASYGFGWARVQLPGTMGGIGCNPGLMPGGMPIVGKGGPSRLVVYHQGSLPGALSAVNLIPKTRTAIVVLSNSLALNDCPDWVGQLVLEEILDVPNRNDYVEAAISSAAKTLEWHPRVTTELQKDQKHNTSSKDLDTYTGAYWNAIKTMKIEVTVEANQLYYAVQGLESEKYVLAHYEDDIFTWIRPRNELVARGRWVDQGAEFWKMKFSGNDQGTIDRLTWVHDLEVAEGESFFKSSRTFL